MLDPDPGNTLPVILLSGLSLLTLIEAAACSAFHSALEAVSPSLLKAGDGRSADLNKAVDARRGLVHPLESTVLCDALLGGSAWAVALVLLFPWRGVPILAGILGYLLVFSVLGVFLPQKAVRRDPDKFAIKHAGAIRRWSRMGLPFLGLCSAIVNGLLRLRGIDPRSLEEDVTEEDILQVVDEAEEQDAIEENEKDMIANILDFNDTTAGETMTHRTDVVAVPDDADLAQVVAAAVESGASRIPVYHEDIDSVVGICYVKDLLPYVGKEIPEGVRVTELMRPAYFVPESKKCSQLFTEMTDRKVQIAIVVDEYGGTAGLITLEDLVESIVGNIQDEYDQEEEGEPRQLSERAFTVDGTMSIDEASDLTGVELPEGDYDTLAGLVTEQLGYLPKEGEHPKIEVAGMTITVLKVEDQRLARLLLVKPEPEEEERHE